MQKCFRNRFVSLVTLVASCLCTVTANAFPDKPIRIVVPFAPGGGTDLIARTLSSVMAQELGQAVIVENKAGGGTVIGTDLVAKSPSDGYTILLASPAHAINPTLVPKLPYNYATAFAPIILIGRSPNVLVVPASSPFKSVQDIVTAAKAHPGKLSFASQGNGTSSHLAGEMFKSLTKTYMIHIPYRGSGPALADVVGGQVDMIFATASAAGGLLDGGRLRALAVTTSERSPVAKLAKLAKLPSLAERGLTTERGLEAYSADTWYGLYAPAGTPSDVITKLNLAAKRAAQSETFKKKLTDEGLIVSAGSPQELESYVKAEVIRWRKVIQNANIKSE